MKGICLSVACSVLWSDTDRVVCVCEPAAAFQCLESPSSSLFKEADSVSITLEKPGMLAASRAGVDTELLFYDLLFLEKRATDPLDRKRAH